ncbi:interleukin-17 receptor C isoform X1 [Cyprinodon tularosa]|uniref:interleukin-17 receptor C isoform X1 n=1 Tax=Cyprinodon tularosa TaxID=77115 RepID=UPI0018E1DFF6|nr:interleukin-17 receptor C isoform X1 [Cyprinodon tularosa]XP_038135791.1 interleukin-17 receptor C isoform X1 [Cyprinodon tularosa]
MFLLKWPVWCIYFILCSSSSGLEIIEHHSDAVICQQAFSDCTIKDGVYNPGDTVDIQFEPSFKLCCKARGNCTLCLVIDTEVSIPTEVENESHSGDDEEEYSENTRNEKSSVTICYQQAASTVPICKKVEFTVNYPILTHQNKSKISMVITDEFHFSSKLSVYPNKLNSPKKEVVAPSEEKVCSQKLRQKYIPVCPVQKFLINHVLKENHIELQIEGNNKSPPSLCVKYEENGHCRRLTQTIIHLSSIAPCMCIQAWDEDDLGPWRTQTCPFNKTGLPSELKHLMWKNISVNVRLSKIFDGSSVLLWNLTAPCRLTGEVSLCYKASICKGGNKERQAINAVSKWRQNSKDVWETQGAFENVDEWISQCVMVKIKGAQQEFGPFCAFDTGRFRWTLLVVGVMLLVSLTGLMIYFLRDYVKKWAWSWRHGGFVKIGKKGHVVLLSPPDVDKSVSESVCQLGTQLCSQGFSVSVDQWCRRDQCTMGPLPWLYSQLQKLDTMGGRILLVLNQKALEKTEEWTLLNQEREVGDQQQTRSTYSDLFTASLFIIQAHKRLGTAADRFVLVKVDSPQRQTHSSDRRLPELLQGLPLFWLPSQSQSLAAELTVVETNMEAR